jgi:hypothetical protein
LSRLLADGSQERVFGRVYPVGMSNAMQRSLTFVFGSIVTVWAALLGVEIGSIESDRRGRIQLLWIAGFMAVVVGLAWWVGSRT